jgi:phospholipase D1/2
MSSKKHTVSPAFWGTLVLLFITTVGGLLWRFTPLHHHLSIEALTRYGQRLQTSPWAPVAMMGIYIVGGLILFFHAVLLWTTVFIFDPWHAFLYCQLGTMASAVTMYGLGRVVRPEFVEQIAGSYLDKVSKALARRGKRTLMILHWFPICPFSILNFISGATHIRFDDFLVGTWVGCTPGLIILVIFSHQIIQILHSHHWLNVLPVVLGIGVLVIGGRTIRSHWLPVKYRKS